MAMHTFGDLLGHYPFRYVDKTKVNTIADINENSQYIQLRGVITFKETVGEKRKKRLVATLEDHTGSVQLVWFRGINFIQRYIKTNTEYLLFGKPTFFRGTPSFNHPEMDMLTGQEVDMQSRIQPVYHTSEKMKTRYLDSKGVFGLVKNLFEKINALNIPENLPKSIIEKYQLLPKYDALKNIHLPENEEKLAAAQRRLKFEELFVIQMRMMKIKKHNQRYKGFIFGKIGDYFTTFFNKKLAFELTGAQKRVLKEIRRDVRTGVQMNRLLQGDVGSGKTIVAVMTILMALDNGFQATLMAPTEILAQQHYNNLSEMLESVGVKVDILTGSVKGKKRRLLLESLELGEIDVLIGTHALIEPTVVFKNLGMAVIDEQHRFGVAQRAKLWAKNTSPPHVLVMTATPIPRTLAMTVYGDLDVSIIDELPPGRKPVVTVHRFDKDRLQVFGFLKEEIAKGRQIYIVYPLIEESEAFDYKDLMDGYESVVRAFPSPEYNVCIVHGRMKPADKEMEMQRFVHKKAQIMVATTVIEVGVNVPNASVMIIESAEKFGLAQLHQLRGRVGRGADQSFCILMTSYKLSKNGKLRIDTMTMTNDGFKIAEVDLKLRGPGNIEGTQQSGILDLKLADITKDQNILTAARSAAAEITEKDPNLQLPEHAQLLYYLQRQKNGGGVNWSVIS